MKSIIIYASLHHGNTKKIVSHMAQFIGADTIDVTQNDVPKISGYDLVGFASGIYFHSFHEKIKDVIDNMEISQKQKVFLIGTCGVGYRDYAKRLKKSLIEKGVPCIGSFQCRGYDTYGIFGKLGGIAKGRPNQKDIKKAENFIQSIARQFPSKVN